MPNGRNVAAPLTLIGSGRSGTTLIEACLNAHPLVQTLNETGGLIFGAAAGAMDSWLPSKEYIPENFAYAGYVVQQALIAVEPSYRPFWFHKPIGLPKLISWQYLPGQKTTSGFPVEWYWKVFDAIFPEAMYMTSLRNPWDVVLSWQRYTGWRQEHVWRDLCDVYEVLEHAGPRLSMTVFFDDLVADPEASLRQILAAREVPFHEATFNRLAEQHAMKPGDAVKRDHRDAWSDCADPQITPEDADLIVRVWKRSGRDFESPARYAHLFRF